MRERIQNRLSIEVEGAPDLTVCKNLLVWIHTAGQEYVYTPTPVSATELLVIVPYEDAMQWDSNVNGEIQLVGTDEDGYDFASEPVETDVKRLLDKEGYDGSNHTSS